MTDNDFEGMMDIGEESRKRQFPDALDEYERIMKMTPDQAYAESVRTLGRAKGITDEMDAAARIPEAEMQRRRRAAGFVDTVPIEEAPAAPAAPAPAAPKTPVAPAAPASDAAGGNGYLPNGKMAGSNPADYEQLESTKMMRRMEQGLPAEESQWRSKLAYDRMSLKERKRLHDSRNGLLADTILRGIAQVNNGGGDLYQNGGKTFRRVKFSGNDGGGPVADLNRMREQMGKSGRMGAMGVYLEVNEDGSAKAGAKPRVWYSHIGADGKGSVKEVADLGTIQEQWAKKYLADNPAKDAEKDEDRLRAARRVAAERFGGNYAGWDLTPTAREKYADEQKLKEQEAARKQQELNLADKQFYAKLGFNEKQLTENARQFDQTFGLDQQKHEEAKREFDATLDAKQKETADKLGVQKMEILANAGAKLAQGGKTQDVLASLPREFVKSYIEVEIPETDGEGKPVLDEVTGAPRFRKPTTEEMRTRFGELKDLAKQAYGVASGSSYYGNLAAQLDGATAQSSASAQGAQAPRNGASPLEPLAQMNGASPAQKQYTPEEIAAARAEKARRAAASSPRQEGDENPDMERRRENGRKIREGILNEANVDESVASHYDSMTPETMQKFRAATGASLADIYSGKYDDKLAAFATRIGDDSTVAVIEQIKPLRETVRQGRDAAAMEKLKADRDAEYNAAVEDINKGHDQRLKDELSELEQEAIRKGWDKKTYDFHVNRAQERSRLGRENDLNKAYQKRHGFFGNRI